MNKDYTENKIKSFSPSKILGILYKLARFIEENKLSIDSKHFDKLKKYHNFIKEHQSVEINKINKEFFKIKTIDYQFQVYLMNLERLLGQSLKEYDFLVSKTDKEQPSKIFPVVCVLDSVRSAHNVGSMLRNAECFGCSRVYLTGLSPKGDHHQVIKTAMGSEQYLEWEYNQSAIDTIKYLKEKNYKILAIETAHNSIDLNELEVDTNQHLALVFGHEQHGLSLEVMNLADQTVSINLFGKKNSLNVSVSQAIVLQQITSLLNDSK